MQETDIELFWKWFSENKDKLESHSYDPTILHQLDKIITTDGNLNWEIGPGQSKENSFAPISYCKGCSIGDIIIIKYQLANPDNNKLISKCR